MPPLRPVYDPFSARRRRTPDWLVRYTASLAAVDVLAVTVGVVVALVVAGPTAVAAGRRSPSSSLWPALVTMSGGYAERRLGAGSDEFRRVFLAGVLAMAG